MRDEPIRRLTRLAPLVAIWLALMVLLASPAWAHDDDDDDDDDGPPPVSTTTTATTVPPPPPTTTIPPPPPPPTTTPPPPPPPTTTTTHRPAPTTTTSTTTTTTPVVPRDESWEEQRLESWLATPTTTTTSAAAENESKETFVLSMGPVDGGNGDDGQGDSRGRGAHISPREGLTVAFRTAVEMIESQLLKALLLGILVAGFVMVGVDKRRAAPAAEAKVLRSFSTSR